MPAFGWIFSQFNQPRHLRERFDYRKAVRAGFLLKSFACSLVASEPPANFLKRMTRMLRYLYCSPGQPIVDS